MEDEKQNNNETELRFTIRNHLKDVYVGQLILICLPPYLWINIAVLAFNLYRITLPLLLVKEYALALFSLAFGIVIVSGFALIIFLTIIVLTFFKTRLKGVVGEHEYTFRSDGFTEKTPYNENNIPYISVARFLETHKYFQLGMPSMNTYTIPKRDLSAAVQESLKKKFQGIKPVKRVFAPYVVLSLVIVSAVSLLFAMSMSKYTVITSPIPFHATWDANTLYISGGKMTTGQILRYKDMLGLGTFSMGGVEPQNLVEQRLWVIREGKVEPYIIQTDMKPIAFCLQEGKLYAVHIDVKSEKQIVSFFTPDAFVEDQSRTPEQVLEACGGAETREKNRPLSTINVYEWDRKVGHGKTLEIPLGNARFELGMNSKAVKSNPEQSPLGESESGTISLVGRWVSEPAQKLETLYSVAVGMKSVNKEAFQQYFGH